MKKEYDFEKAERRKYIVIDWAFNAFIVILISLALLGLLFCIKEFNISAELGGLLYVALLIGGACVIQFHKEADWFWNRKAIERHLKQPKFEYLSDEQRNEIISEINHIL